MKSLLPLFLFLTYAVSPAIAEERTVYDQRWACENLQPFERIDQANGYELYKRKLANEYEFAVTSPFSHCPVLFKIRNPLIVSLQEFINEFAFGGWNGGIDVFHDLANTYCAEESRMCVGRIGRKVERDGVLIIIQSQQGSIVKVVAAIVFRRQFVSEAR